MSDVFWRNKQCKINRRLQIREHGEEHAVIIANNLTRLSYLSVFLRYYTNQVHQYATTFVQYTYPYSLGQHTKSLGCVGSPIKTAAAFFPTVKCILGK
jgi:hypothetical protein